VWVFTPSFSQRIAVCLLFKNLGRQMPEDVREEWEALVISVQDVFQLCSGHRYQDATKACQLTPNFVVSVARGCELLKVHSLTTVWPANLGGDIHHP
jgi:hypothetical protein